MKNQPKILLIGSNGQLGTDISRRFKQKKFSFIPIYERAHFDLSFVQEKIYSFLINNHPDIDYIINTAALTDTSYCENNPDDSHRINGTSLAPIARFANEVNATLIHFSTDYVFDGQKKAPYKEQDYCQPLSVYGRSKLISELIIQDYLKKFFIFRVSSLFGIHGNNFIEKIITKAMQQEKLSIINDQFMSPTHTHDVSLMVSKVIQQEFCQYGVYHMANEGQCSWYDFTKKIFEIYEIKVPEIQPVSASDFKSPVTRPQYSVLSTEKLQKRIFTPPSWEKSLEQYFELRKCQKV